MATWIIGGMVFAGVTLAAWKIIKDRREGRPSCGCDCSSCHRACRSHE